jgi:membrane protein implicated in regulation of membrane protease activity
VLIFVAIALLLVLDSPWNYVAFFVLIPLWLLELFGWNQTVKHRRRAVGAETLIGRDAVVTTPLEPLGQVRLDGEIWAARCSQGAREGQHVRVIGRDRLTLVVELVVEDAQSSAQSTLT